MLVSPHPGVSLGSRPVFTSGARSRASHASIPAFGYRWCTWVAQCLDQASFETRLMSRIVILFILGKSNKNGVMHRIFFVVIYQDKKIPIQDKHLTNRVFFRSF